MADYVDKFSHVRTGTAQMDDCGSFKQLYADRVMTCNRRKELVGVAFGPHASFHQ